MPKEYRISPTFNEVTYNQIKQLAHKENKDMSQLIREWTEERLKGEVTQNHIDFLCRIMREQLKDVLTPYMERIIALSAKSSIQAGTAAYLTAETISRFLPAELSADVQEVYEQARKKAIRDNQSKITDEFT